MVVGFGTHNIKNSNDSSDSRKEFGKSLEKLLPVSLLLVNLIKRSVHAEYCVDPSGCQSLESLELSLFSRRHKP